MSGFEGIVSYVILALFIAVAFCTDITAFKISNRLNVIGLIGGVAVHGGSSGIHGLLFSAGGAASGMGAVLILYALRALGAGDVKLFAAIGAISGTEFALTVLMYAIVFSGVIGIVLILGRKQLMQRIRLAFQNVFIMVSLNNRGWLQVQEGLNGKQMLTFPFMLAVLPAVITTGWYLM